MVLAVAGGKGWARVTPPGICRAGVRKENKFGDRFAPSLAAAQLASFRKVKSMIRTSTLSPLLLVGVALLFHASESGSQGQGDKGKDKGKPSQYQLSLEEQRLMRSIAGNALSKAGLINAQEKAFMLGEGKDDEKDKMVVTGQEVLPPASTGDRKVRTTFYRYRENRSIVVLMDLITEKALKVEEQSSDLSGLAEEETARAIKLAMDHPVIKKWIQLYGDRFQVERVFVAAGAAKGQRLVGITFSLDGATLPSPRLLVDLTAPAAKAVTVRGQ